MNDSKQLAQRIIEYLNSLLEVDRSAIAALVANHVPCNQALADHPTVQVGAQGGGHHVGLLGILNGLCGIRLDGFGYIGACFDEDPDDGQIMNLVKFFMLDDDVTVEINAVV